MESPSPLKSRSTHPDPERPLVVLVHGLLMTGLDLTLLARRLRRCGFATRIFSYASVRGDIDDSVERLYRFVAALHPVTLHLVGHSLGGLWIRVLLGGHPELPRGRWYSDRCCVMAAAAGANIGPWKKRLAWTTMTLPTTWR